MKHETNLKAEMLHVKSALVVKSNEYIFTENLYGLFHRLTCESQTRF